LVANEPVSNEEFMKTLAKSLGSSSWLPNAPAFAMRLVLGEMSQLVLGGSRVSNEKMRASGYVFKFPNLVGALEDLK
jgi:NAD dependent epimerase/dehydratase family enzyme